MKDKMILKGETIDLQKGLDADQVRRSLEKNGSNILTPPEREPWWVQFLEKFEDPTIKILLAAAIVSLLMTGLEKFVLGHPEASFIDSIGIFLAVLLATLCGFFSELKSAREFDLLNKVKDDIRIKVLRNGQMTEVSINDIVVGDLVHIDLGDKIPADGIVLDAMGLLVDQSVMTGESVPVEKLPYKGAETSLPADLVSDNQYLLYRGTMVNDGHGLFLVMEVGDKTKLGQIAANLGKDNETEAETPLTSKLSVLAKQISVVGITGAMMIFTVMALSANWNSELLRNLLEDKIPFLMILGIGLFGAAVLSRFALQPFFTSMNMKMQGWLIPCLTSIPLFTGMFGIAMGLWGIFDEHGSMQLGMELMRELLTCFVVAVTIIVVAVPEGLPMMVTVSLAMNMMKMARENVLVRKLVASETIGSATIVCTDKTGTLTQNRMSTAWLLIGLKSYEFHDDDGNFDSLRQDPSWPLLVESISANSEASLHIETIEDKSGKKEIVEGIGNPTECALLRLLHDAGIDYRQYRDKYPRLWELSHNSQRKLSLVVVDRNEQEKTCFIKGAPDRLLEHCTHVYVNGNREPIESHRTLIQSALDAAATKALRVIAFTVKDGNGRCFDEVSGEKCLECPGHALLALIGIADPIRPEVRAAIETCHHAGVEVKMITGDAEPTAIAIARQAGILSKAFDPTADTETEIQQGELVLTSSSLAKMDDKKLLEAVPSLKVLARSTPMDKLRLVKAMHREGEVVAMTGDGTNDAPALKFADVGVSMGMTGTEVAKEASDIVLIDDNFKSIVTGIWWGRTLYQNIQRFLQFQLSVNVVALSCALLGPIVGIPLPLTVPQLLWINIIMDTFAAIAMSCDPPRKKSMERKPVSRDASIITPSMGVSILLNSLYQVVILFAALYSGWFLSPEYRFDFAKDPMGRNENLQALTVFFTIFVMFQFWHKFNCRSLRHDESPFEMLHKNKLFILIVVAITVAQIVMVQASKSFGIGEVFRTEPLSLMQWIGISLLTATIIPIAWLVRRLIYCFNIESFFGKVNEKQNIG